MFQLYSVFGLLAVETFNYGKEVMERESSGGHQTRRPSGFQQMQVLQVQEVLSILYCNTCQEEMFFFL